MDALSYRLELGVVGIVWNCIMFGVKPNWIPWGLGSPRALHRGTYSSQQRAGMLECETLESYMMGHVWCHPPPKKVCFFSGKFQLPAPQADFLRCLCMELKGGEWEVGDHSEFFSQNEPVVTYLDPPCRHILGHMTRPAHDGQFV